MMRTMRRYGLILLVFSIAALLCLPIFSVRAGTQGDLDIVELSVEDAAKFIRQDKGRAVLVLLYASWCPSCQKFLPEFLRLADRYRDREVDALAFSVNDTKEEVAEYLRDFQLTSYRSGCCPGRRAGWGRPWPAWESPMTATYLLSPS